MASSLLTGSLVASKSVRTNPFSSSSSTAQAGFGFLIAHGRISRSFDLRYCGVRASMVDSYGSSSNFARRMDQAWLISQQPRPVVCSSCESNGHIECKWCAGTGFFILGDNMLCQVPSRNNTCIICSGKGSMRCSDCKGTGFRAKWLEEPPLPE